MTNKHFIRCDRFETKFGEGSVLFFINLIQSGKTYEEIAKTFKEKYGQSLSVSQFYKYAVSFVVTNVIPSSHVEKYYHRKEYEQYYMKMLERDKRFIEIARQDNIIFGNFLPEAEDAK